jgi:amino acid adenylation domain-containing protein
MNVEKNAIAERFSRLPKEKQKVFLELLRKQGIDFARLPIVPAAVDARRALSYAQLRQWFIWQLDPQSTAYHISGALKLDGTLDLPALRASFDALVARHESLRTVFRSDEDGLAEQVILAHTAFDIAVIDLSGDAATQERLSEEARHLKATPFDLTQGPLLRVGVIRVSDREHVLVVVMHHIVSDGWSMQILVDEFMAQYAARVQGRTLVPNPLAIQYADYAAWQRNWLEAGEKERQLAYWIAQLSSDAPVLQLKADHARRADASYRMARHDMVLPPALAQALNTRAKDQSATLFMVLLAGFQALLHRCTGLQDIRVGVPIANRHREETEKIIGFFVNTQVLRNEIDGQTSLAQVLARSRDAAIGAQAHQDLPFEQLVDALRPDRTLSVSPLFQVMFNYQRAGEQAPLTLPGLQLEAYVLQEQAAQFELTLDIGEGADGRVEASFGYAAELFEPQTVARMAGHYLAMLDALAERPQQTVADVDLLSSEERLWLSNCGDNREAHGDAQPVHRQIEAHAKRQPNATALLFGDEVLSYDELNRRANRLAHRLIALGVKPESLVGIAVERSVEMMVGILAILKAGGAYVPLDPEYPGERLSYMVADSGIELLLTQSHLRTLIPGTQAQQSLQVLELDTLDTRSEPDHDPEVALHGESLAYVIYTSGSTGKPKGAAIRHDALYSCMAWMQQAYRLTEADTVLHKAPFGFDVSCWEMFWPLTSGVRLVIANPGDHRDPERLVQLIQRHQITTLNFVPSMLQAFLAHEGIEASTRLKHIIVGGEAMPAQTQREALRRLHGATLQNLYGPTETTIHVTRWTCRDDGQSQVPIGRPISQTQALVLDGSLNPVPQGVAGELYLGGISLARGYLKRAGLTAERFVATEGGQRLYRTGDLVRWNNEGQLEYLGRIDHQVKVRGFRIELGEIEAQLLAQESVREAVVVANQGPAGARLVGYVSGQDIDTAVLRARLAEALPDYMVPGALVVLDALPLNANGKVDRKALPDAQFGGAQEYEAPQGEVEEALSQIWSQVLGVQRVGRNDNFFELGGNSILALQAIALGRRRSIPPSRWNLQALLRHPTIRDGSQEEAASSDSLTLLNRKNAAATPLFCIHSGLGTVLGYLPLAHRLNGQRPVYGVACRTLNNPLHRDASLESMAADYVQLVRAVQPEGPYSLLGWSLGGAIAALMAARLEAEGERIEFLGLVDSYIPGAHDIPSRRDWRSEFAFFLNGIAQDHDLLLQVPQEVCDPFESEEPLIRWSRELMEQRGLRFVGKYEGVSAAEVVRLFLADHNLYLATTSVVHPLAPVSAQIDCWWTKSQGELAIEEVSLQLDAGAIGVHYRIDDDHLGIIENEEFLAQLSQRLTSQRQVVPQKRPRREALASIAD